jgi:dTMP kinase
MTDPDDRRGWRDRANRTYTPAVDRPQSWPARGRFITLEGPEGAGKTTQAQRLVATLRDRGVSVVSTREPGGTELGERIRALLLSPDNVGAAPVDPLVDALLFNAARRQLVAEVIEPALALGTTVVCARFGDSTRAYQGYGGGVPIAELARLEAVATGGLRPDRTILLDVPVEIGLARKAPDERTRFETAFDLSFHQRVRNGFMAMAAAEPARFVVVDGTGDPDEIARRIARAVAPPPRSIESSDATAGEPKPPEMRIPR